MATTESSPAEAVHHLNEQNAVALSHPRLESPDEILRWVHALQMTSEGLFKAISSMSKSGVVSHRHERFLTWSQCASREPINLAVGTKGWRRDGADVRFDLAMMRAASDEELAIATGEVGLQNCSSNPFMALNVDGGTTLLVDAVTVIERVILQSQLAFDLAVSPLRDLFIECEFHDTFPVLSSGPLPAKQRIQVIAREGISGPLLRLISWLKSEDWQRYFAAILLSIRKGAAPPLPPFALSGWLRYDGLRVRNYIFAEYLHAVVDQIERHERFAYRTNSRTFSWHSSGEFPRLRDGDVDFDHPYSYSMTSKAHA